MIQAINLEYFTISQTTLLDIISATQNRTKSEQLDLLESKADNPTNWLVDGLLTSIKTGIKTEQKEMNERISIYGTNQIHEEQPPGFFQLFWESLQDFTLRILIVASFLSIAIQVGTASNQDRRMAWVQGFAIFMAVIISSLVTTINNYQKQRQFIKLNQVAQSRKRVMIKRNGQQIETHQNEILVGDLIMLTEGMEVPSDGYLVQAYDITTDQSAMTGQNDPIIKDLLQRCLLKKKEVYRQKAQSEIEHHQIPTPIILSGTRILTGTGAMIAIVVGQNSCLGKLRALAGQKTKSVTPLQQKLQKVSKDISKFGLFSAIFIVIVLLIRFTIVKIISLSWNTHTDILLILNYFILGITVIVVAIPEGLPLSVSLSLAFSVKKMQQDANLVRRLQACETMGGANMICSDKTGTLTTNIMTLTSFYNTERFTFDLKQQSIQLQKYLNYNKRFLQLFKISACVNNASFLRPEQKGSATDIGILKFIEKSGIKYETERQKYQIIQKFPFNSKRKRMSTLIKLQNQQYLFTKGASELILRNCNRWYNSLTSTIEPLKQSISVHIQNIIEEMASQTLRTICFAYKIVKNQNLQEKDQKGVHTIEVNDLIFLCVIGIRDVPRPQVPLAIQKCKKAGIKVRMVTGDNLKTASAIANQIGIISNKQTSLVLEGSQFMKLIQGVMCKTCQTQICDCERDYRKAAQNKKKLRVDTIKNMPEFERIIGRLDVLARSRPEDKYALVIGLKELGNIVAVTGDGTNDAPALKAADIGFAMGQSGTEVARQAAGIILLDDNFNSIVKAVLWGRNIYDSIKKFVQFQLTVNLVAVFITLVGALILQSEVLKPIQMLWVNLIMDTLASLALATQPPSEQLLDRKPHSRSQYIISKKMFKHILFQGIYQIIVLMILIFAGEFFIPEYADAFDNTSHFQASMKYYNGISGGTIRSGRLYYANGSRDYFTILQQTKVYSRHFTFIFNTFVMMQIFNFINSRKLLDELNVFSRILENSLFIIIIFVVLAFQIIIITFGSIAFGVYAYYGLTIQQWFISIAIASISLIVSFLTKFINEQRLFCQKTNEVHSHNLSIEKAAIPISSSDNINMSFM